MDHLFSEVLEKFKNKGLAQFEIIELIKDFALINQTNYNRTLDIINEELENLGWGIHVMDITLCEKLTFLINRANLKNFETFIAQAET